MPWFTSQGDYNHLQKWQQTLVKTQRFCKVNAQSERKSAEMPTKRWRFFKAGIFCTGDAAQVGRRKNGDNE